MYSCTAVLQYHSTRTRLGVVEVQMYCIDSVLLNFDSSKVLLHSHGTCVLEIVCDHIGRAHHACVGV